MTVEVPDDYADRFTTFDAIYAMLSKQTMLSTASVATAFRAFANCPGGAWRDPSFLVWAGVRKWTSCQQIRDAALKSKHRTKVPR